MGPDLIVDLFREALKIIIMLICIIVLPGLCVGLIVSIFQAATQINEQTLSFVPRLIVTMLSLIFFGPWMINQVLSFTERLVSNMSQYVV